jgi:hypothetical protein
VEIEGGNEQSCLIVSQVSLTFCEVTVEANPWHSVILRTRNSASFFNERVAPEAPVDEAKNLIDTAAA